MVSNLLNAGQDVLLYALTLIAALAILFSQLDESVTVARQKSEDSGKRIASMPPARCRCMIRCLGPVNSEVGKYLSFGVRIVHREIFPLRLITMNLVVSAPC